ncbi:MAG TPA: hypothetical protein VMJ10_24105 [Kofleriaceae bacterium]|nr:hypothetical protein [Kofleriaceae bacterium]
MRHLVPLGWALSCAGCPGNVSHPDAPKLTAQEAVDKLAAQRAAKTSFVADTTMDYWLGSQRAKGEVLVMGAVGAKLRFAALSPAGGSTMAEMACDGTNFVYVDYQNNCQLAGPCDQRSIAQFFHIALQPDDFIHLALGTPPVIEGTPKLTWDGKHENLEVTGAQGTQHVAFAPDTYDVAASDLAGADGKVRWSVENRDFVAVGGQRVPGKTRFKSAANQQDLLVDWGSADNRKINTALPPEKFALQAPAGLPNCK